MKFPTRLKETSGADPFALSLLKSAQQTRSIPPANRQRGARHAARLGALPLTGLAVGLFTKSVAAAFGTGFVGALLLVAASPSLRAGLSPAPVVAAQSVAPKQAAPNVERPTAPAPSGVDGAANTQARGEESAPQSTAAAMPLNALPARQVEPARTLGFARAAASSPPPASATSNRQRALTQPQNQPQKATGIAAELELVSAARKLLSTDPFSAQLLLDRHREAFPNGALSLEREVLSIEVLKQTGQRARAIARAREYLADPGNRFYAARLQRVIDDE